MVNHVTGIANALFFREASAPSGQQHGERRLEEKPFILVTRSGCICSAGGCES